MTIKKILCFGDSNTWGYIPEKEGPDNRYPSTVRWTGVLQSRLGAAFEILEEGLNSRTTCLDDPEAEGKNGLAALPAILKKHGLVDLFVLALGTNDLKKRFDRKPVDVANGIQSLVRCVKSHYATNVPRILVLSPPLPKLKFIYDSYQYPELEVKARQLSALYQAVTEKERVEFADLSKVIEASVIDGAHLDAQEHKKLAAFLYGFIVA